MLQYLLLSGAFPAVRMDDGGTALHVVCHCLSSLSTMAALGGDGVARVVAAAQALLLGGVPQCSDNCGRRPLHIAASAGCLPLVQLLCAKVRRVLRWGTA